MPTLFTNHFLSSHVWFPLFGKYFTWQNQIPIYRTVIDNGRRGDLCVARPIFCMQNIGISEGNRYFIAFGDGDLCNKSHGRAKHAPTMLYDSLFAKLGFIGELPLRRSRLGPLFEGAVSVADWGSVVLKIGHSLRLCLSAKPPPSKREARVRCIEITAR